MTAQFKTADAILRTYDPIHEEPPKQWYCGVGFEHFEIGPGRVSLLGGGPGSGKTTLVNQLTTDAMRLDRSLRTLVCNVEMTARVLLDRSLARLSGIDLTTIAKRRLTAQHEPRIRIGMNALREFSDRLAFIEAPYDLPNIVATCEEFQPDLIVLDYVQRIGTGGEHSNKRAAVDALMTSVRKLADADTAVICVAAVSRQRSKTGNANYGGLGLASFRESSELEFGADSAFVLQPSVDAPGIVELRHVKNRHGELTDKTLMFDGRHQSFSVAKTDDLISAAFPSESEAGQ